MITLISRKFRGVYRNMRHTLRQLLVKHGLIFGFTNALSYQQFAEVATWKIFKVQYVKKGGILLWIKLHKRKLIKDKLAWKCAFLLSSQIHWKEIFTMNFSYWNCSATCPIWISNAIILTCSTQKTKITMWNK